MQHQHAISKEMDRPYQDETTFSDISLHPVVCGSTRRRQQVNNHNRRLMEQKNSDVGFEMLS